VTEPGTATALAFDPFQAGQDADPYPLFDRMRDEAPVYHDADHGFYAVSRYDDVQKISRDWERFSNAEGIDIDRTGDYFGPNFLDSDPPRHRTMRSLVQRRFSPGTVRETLEPVIRAEVSRLVETAVEAGSADVANDLAWPLPFSIACHLLGFPVADRDFLWGASRRFIERDYGERLPPAVAQEAAEELRAYVAEIAGERRRNPGDDLLSLLATSEVDGSPLPEGELVGNAFLLFDAGTQTTACMLSSALVLLDAYPDQRRWLIDNPDRVAQAVEEVLRFESPVQHLTRTTTVEVEIHDVRIPPGETVALLYGAANRDPRKWPEPERFDLAREPVRNLAFGDGIHHCLGAPIARLEASIALEVLLPHLDDFHLTEHPTRLRSHLLRGYVSAPAAFSHKASDRDAIGGSGPSSLGPTRRS
jgi:cytochrome P450